MKKRDLVKKVARKVGEPPISVMITEGRINPATYLRARVFLDLNKPLVRVVPITLKERRKFLVRHERLLVFCNYCGLLGHEVTKCGDGTHKKECAWGDWLLVKFGSTIGGRGEGGDGRARGGMQGRAVAKVEAAGLQWMRT
jgi:hypothetical protein